MIFIDFGPSGALWGALLGAPALRVARPSHYHHQNLAAKGKPGRGNREGETGKGKPAGGRKKGFN